MLFEQCTTLLDLNRERIAEVKKHPADLENINRAYQERRAVLVTLTPDYKRLTLHRPNVVIHQLQMGIPYAGPCSEELTIKYTPKGFEC